MDEIRRVIWIILDSVGAGAMPDADRFGDKGANTLVHVWEKNGGLNIPNLVKMGIGNISGVTEIPKEKNPLACYGRLSEMSNGKDTTIGHWEMTGIYSPNKFPTYPQGFPQNIIDDFIKKAGVPGILGNCTASGTEIIKELGVQHISTAKPIVYTSADSVFQIACHEEVYPPEKLYEICQIAREILCGEHAVARVIARPFAGEDGSFYRTSNRRDFSLKPGENNLLVKMKEKGMEVIAVGKIEDIFAGSGITEAVHTKDNMDGVDKTLEYMKKKEGGLIFTNLVEFDSTWGHRRDYKGYGKGLEDFDMRLEEIISSMKRDDLLIINADHGCDPTFKGTDHTREYIPVLMYGKSIKSGVDIGTGSSFADIGQTIADIFGIGKLDIGSSMLNRILI
ncbi:MAG: phosphopentomutase [Lachnospiraceae bacterium]|nr:phosphopentomutase [Lachnospiraceae bacterium]